MTAARTARPRWSRPFLRCALPQPLSTAELEQQLGEGGVDAVLEKTVAAWQPVYERSDVVIVEGLSPGPAWLYASELNQALARALDADVIVVGRWPAADAPGQGGPQPGPDLRALVEDLAETLAITASGYLSGERARVVGCVIRSLPAAGPPAAAQLGEALSRHGLRLLAAVPHRPELAWLRVRDLVRELDPRILYEGDLSRRIKDVAVFAQGVPGGLRVLTEGRLVVVPGDRHEVVMAACLAALNGTRLAALLLSAGIAPDPRVWELTQAASATGLPILVAGDNSYETATRVRAVDPGLPADDLERIDGVVNTIADALDAPWLESLPGPARSRRLSPAAFRYQVVERARAAAATIVLPEGTEPRTLQAAVACAERGIARSVLLGPPDQVAAAGPRPRPAAARRRHRGRPARRRRALRRPARRAAAPPRLDRGSSPRAPHRPRHGRHHDAPARRSGRPGRGRAPYHRGHGPPGAAGPGHQARHPAGVVGVLHVPAR